MHYLAFRRKKKKSFAPNFRNLLKQPFVRKMSIEQLRSCEKSAAIFENINIIGFGACITRFGKSAYSGTEGYWKKCAFWQKKYSVCIQKISITQKVQIQ